MPTSNTLHLLDEGISNNIVHSFNMEFAGVLSQCVGLSFYMPFHSHLSSYQV